MRLLVFHGYLLRGTGSNVYNAELAAALVRMGHQVHLLSQERRPEDLPFVDAVGEWEDGRLQVRQLRTPVRCTVYRPDIGGLLPVYVPDHYEGIEARPFPELGDEELDAYVERNVAAVRQVADAARPDGALANHLVMGPLILARALEGTGIPYAVKIHGSALEYTVKPHPRFLPHAREGLAPARAVLVGSRHTAESLWATLDDPELPPRTRLGPPGVDVHAFGPHSPEEVTAGLSALADGLRDEQELTDPAFGRDPGRAATSVASLRPGAERLVAFVGKLIVSKGVDLLLASWPLVLAREPAARLVVIGFGAYREACERLVVALADGDLAAVRELARAGRAAEGGEATALAYLTAFLDELEADPEQREGYLAAARGLRQRVVFTGRLEHGELVDLLPACEALVVPSTFPESYGMVAAEAAACGVLPISANHSGLAEVTAVLASALPRGARPLLSFDLGPRAVPDLAQRVGDWLQASQDLRWTTRQELVRAARERFSWEGVAHGVVAAAQGRLEVLRPTGG
jgi:glycosyltransferase involved in cell wall biosynthesis